MGRVIQVAYRTRKMTCRRLIAIPSPSAKTVTSNVERFENPVTVANVTSNVERFQNPVTVAHVTFDTPEFSISRTTFSLAVKTRQSRTQNDSLVPIYPFVSISARSTGQIEFYDPKTLEATKVDLQNQKSNSARNFPLVRQN